MIKFTFTLLITGLSFTGFTQDTSKIANIQTLLELTGSGKLGVQVVQNMFASYKQSLPNVPEEFWDNFMKEVKPEILTSMIIPIYDKYYSAEDIKILIEFYKTPVGQKVISTMPQVMQESMQAGQAWGKEIGEKVYTNLKDKGYIDQKQ